MKKLLKYVALVIGLVLALSGQATAASQTSGITITPFLQNIKFSAEEGTKEFVVTLRNDSDKTQNIELSVLDFGSLNETGGLVFAGSDASALVKKYGLADWLQLSTSSLSVEAGKSASVKATVIDDISLAPGGHYAAVVASINSGDPSANQIKVNQKLSSLIFATKTGGEQYDLKLDKIDASSSRFGLPAFVTLHFHNPGNVHVVPRGTVRIVSPDGEIVSQGVINEESGFVLPETSRQIAVKLKTIGRMDLRASVYKIRVDYRYDGLDTFARQEQPVYITSVLGLVLLAVISLIIAWLIVKLKLPETIPAAVRKFFKHKK